MRTKLFLLVPILVLALVLSACGSAAPAGQAAPRTLNVSGTGTVTLTPDIAYIFIGVHTEDPEIATAVDKNNTQAQAVVDALRGMGIAAVDIQTSNFSVWSSQQYDPSTGMYTGIIYMVDNTVYVTVRDLATLPAVLDAAIAAGANNINSVQFDVADKTAALAEARQKAMENAASLAGELATNAGVELGDIQNISYSEYLPTAYYGYGMGGGGGGGAEGAASAPISPGQMQLTVTISVTYEIK
jgi:hypothetical protein